MELTDGVKVGPPETLFTLKFKWGFAGGGEFMVDSSLDDFFECPRGPQLASLPLSHCVAGSAREPWHGSFGPRPSVHVVRGGLSRPG